MPKNGHKRPIRAPCFFGRRFSALVFLRFMSAGGSLHLLRNGVVCALLIFDGTGSDSVSYTAAVAKVPTKHLKIKRRAKYKTQKLKQQPKPKPKQKARGQKSKCKKKQKQKMKDKAWK